MVKEGPIPSVEFDATLLGKKHYYDAWRETVRPIYDVEPLLPEVAERRGGVKAWFVDNLIFTDVAFSPQSFSHHASHAENAGYLSLQVYRHGQCQGISADRPFRMRPGEMHLFDYSREHHSVGAESAVAGVVIPYDVIGYDPARHPGYVKVTDIAAIGSTLINAFMLLLDQLPGLGKDEASGLAGGFCELLRRHVIPGSDDDPKTRRRRAERRAEMRSYIEQHLENAELGVAQLCRAFGASEPTIYRDFADVGGVARYVAMRRLSRAYRQLVAAQPGRGQVQEIASRCGFDDPLYFSRLFNQRFGVRPSALLSRVQADPMLAACFLSSDGGSLGERTIGEWLKLI